MCNRDATIAGLLALGWTLDPTARTSKYQVYARTADTERKMLVGRSGALRAQGVGKTVAESLSLTDSNYHKAVREVGRRSASYSSPEQARADLNALYQGQLAPLS